MQLVQLIIRSIQLLWQLYPTLSHSYFQRRKAGKLFQDQLIKHGISQEEAKRLAQTYVTFLHLYQK
ncbi:hypothetical protein [Thermoflavimicrobium daqui]|uniref:Uncharacterized protein n=1 Tax=Thermoflavimicrobium daqui TaxID=2137476 RepID=A0A364K6D3_9BACL|nr:hypothetical protein [Thermoflavimicrobium daqui]RAL25871.1 hypothetical protein DL897_07280 [Thermoflavimicrobium daqui]